MCQRASYSAATTAPGRAREPSQSAACRGGRFRDVEGDQDARTTPAVAIADSATDRAAAARVIRGPSRAAPRRKSQAAMGRSGMK